jgi:xanthine/uracil/vitamin C permease (AzgA family)
VLDGVVVLALVLLGWREAAMNAIPRDLRRAIAVGIVASFASTLASQRLIELVERDRALWPYAVYRTALAAVVLARLARVPTRPPRRP